MPRPITNPEHGTVNRYKLRRDPCRCPLCRNANARYKRAIRKRHGSKTEVVAEPVVPDYLAAPMTCPNQMELPA